MAIGSMDPHLVNRARYVARVDLYAYRGFVEEEQCQPVRCICVPQLTHRIRVNHSQDLTTSHAAFSVEIASIITTLNLHGGCYMVVIRALLSLHDASGPIFNVVSYTFGDLNMAFSIRVASKPSLFAVHIVPTTHLVEHHSERFPPTIVSLV